MIKKSFELKKTDFENCNFFLFYGSNEGLKKEIIHNLLINTNEVFKYEEKEILENLDSFIENLNTKSLFENKKIIIINRTSDKILKFILEIISKNFEDLKIILNSGNLEKKSKIRSLFEKEKKLLCVPFYPDTHQTLFGLASNFLKRKNISISSSDINVLINKSNESRETLLNELLKIENFASNGKQITSNNIFKLVNLIENHNINELIDNCLAKNKKKIVNILNENNYNTEDCIIILRTFLSKAKRILKLAIQFKKNKDVNKTINSAKPPIFWKDKDIIKVQLYKWKPEKLKELIENINNIEIEIKKNYTNSILIITNFILEKSSSDTSN